MGKSKLSVGDKIPEFELLNQNNERVRISPLDHKKRIIYFYPKDDTKVCTKQACSFRDWQSELTEKGYEVIGISSDSPAAHLKFQANNNLNFLLLSDKGGKVRKLFGATNLLGLIPARKTYLISEEGIVEFEYEAMFEGEEHIHQLKKYLK